MCCGRSETTIDLRAERSAAATASKATVPEFRWKWGSINGVDTQTFDSEQEVHAHIKAGNPGTITVIAV
jgi:hypothetical protein